MSSFTTPLKYEKTGAYISGNPVYRITEPFTYCFGSLSDPIATFTVPIGFETDMASIPWPINILFPPDGPWAKAAVLHDYITNNGQQISELVQDAIFYEAMRVLNINEFLCWLFFTFVRLYRGFHDGF